MTVDNIKNMKWGWFVGDFEPSMFPSNEIEVGYKKYKRGQLEGIYSNKVNTEVLLLCKGKMKAGKRILSEGDILRLEPNETKCYIFLEDSEAVIVKSPGGNEDRVFEVNIEEELFETLQGSLSLLLQDKDKAPKLSDIKMQDISVVVQGIIEYPIIEYCLSSIRRCLPGAEIILSTWEGSNVSGLDADQILLNKDPGAVELRENVNNNLNRQLVSTQNGLAKAKRKYILKMRSDLCLTNSSFLDYYTSFQENRTDYVLFQKRVLIAETFSRHFLKQNGGELYMPFHPSDWFAFGLAEDVHAIYDIPLMKPQDMIGYSFSNREVMEKFKYGWPGRYLPEQYITYSAFCKKYQVQFNDVSDFNEENIKVSEAFLYSNFIPLNLCQHGFVILKPRYMGMLFRNSGISYDEEGLWKYSEFIENYQKYN